VRSGDKSRVDSPPFITLSLEEGFQSPNLLYAEMTAWEIHRCGSHPFHRTVQFSRLYRV
jgi:hypothetical protein